MVTAALIISVRYVNKQGYEQELMPADDATPQPELCEQYTQLLTDFMIPPEGGRRASRAVSGGVAAGGQRPACADGWSPAVGGSD